MVERGVNQIARNKIGKHLAALIGLWNVYLFWGLDSGSTFSVDFHFQKWLKFSVRSAEEAVESNCIWGVLFMV